MLAKTRKVFQETTIVLVLMVVLMFALTRPVSAIELPKIPMNNQNIEVTVDEEELFYTGNPVTPKLTVTMRDIMLRANNDYTVMYVNNTNVGTGYAKVYGKGIFGGKVLIPFEIKPSGQSIAEYASTDEFVGLPYVYGGTSKDGFDCSGFCQYIYRQFGIELPRTASEQMCAGTKVSSIDSLQPGDLVIFYGGGHVGIYVGDGAFVHAANERKGLIITHFYGDDDAGDHYGQNFTSGARII